MPDPHPQGGAAVGAAEGPWLVRLLGWIAGVFFHVERRGGPVPDGPVLVAANHPNSLLDPLIVFRVAGRPTRPLAKAPLFDQVAVGFMLRALGGLPVYRRQDDATQMHRNEDTFRRAIDALAEGSAIQIFPEGISHDQPGLAPLRTGAARIALAAEAESDWSLGVRIVPVGLTYRHKSRFRGHALATIGDPIVVGDWKDAYGADDHAAARGITDTLAARMRTVMLDVMELEDEALIDTAERIWAREKGLAGWRERQDLAERMPRLQAFARGLAWLRLHDPERQAELAHEARAYADWQARLGVTEGDVPPAYETGPVLHYALREGFLLLLGLPFALVGGLLWSPVWFAARFSVRRARPDPSAISTWKLAGGFVVAPLLWIAFVTLAGVLGGWIAALVAAVAVPLLGFAALAWGERFLDVREDADLFLRIVRRPDLAARMDARRDRLIAAFDELADLVPPDPTSPRTAATPDPSAP